MRVDETLGDVPPPAFVLVSAAVAVSWVQS